MDLTQLANLGEFLGGIAVLVTLIYLAVQVRHTRVQQDAQLLALALQTTYAASDPVFHGENMRILWAGLAGADALSEDDKRALHALLTRQLGGLVLLSRSDDDVAQALVVEYKQLFGMPGGKAWLDENPNQRFRQLTREAFRSIEDGKGRS